MPEQNPQKAISQPAIRFKGFTDSWEQRKLDSLKELKKSLLKAMFI